MDVRWPPLNAMSWTGIWVALGLTLRVYHYLRDLSVWHDEAMLLLNVLGRDFVELLGPLDYVQAAPPLFLWLERVAVLLAGDSTYALRFVPFLASCAALVLFVPAARRVLSPQAVPWAVLIFACSDKVLAHGCEAKQYTVDVLAATILLTLFVCTSSWSSGRRLAGMAVVAPCLLFVSYPACFLCGGLYVALLPEVWRSPRWRDWLLYGLLGAAMAAAFLVLYFGPIRAQRNPEFYRYWHGVNQFPPWDRAWLVPVWTVTQTLEVFRYCYPPIGQLVAGLGVVGAILMWRSGARTLTTFLIVPVILALLASYVGVYPYGGTRLLVYALPAVALFIAAGTPPVLAWLRARSQLAAAVLIVLLLVPLGMAAYRVVVPWTRADSAGAAAHVLARRHGTDGVTANHAEHDYYFRHLGDAYAPMQRSSGPSSGRLWLVVTSHRFDERESIVQEWMPKGWRVLERCEFTWISVVLLGDG